MRVRRANLFLLTGPAMIGGREAIRCDRGSFAACAQGAMAARAECCEADVVVSGRCRGPHPLESLFSDARRRQWNIRS